MGWVRSSWVSTEAVSSSSLRSSSCSIFLTRRCRNCALVAVLLTCHHFFNFFFLNFFFFLNEIPVSGGTEAATRSYQKRTAEINDCLTTTSSLDSNGSEWWKLVHMDKKILQELHTTAEEEIKDDR